MAFPKLEKIEELQSSQFSNEDDYDEELYEKIEAPKYVDFTVPDLSLPDDRSWFCLRVGCDQKHEEDMDPEALYKSFVLRVMAARSPNLRLRKALARQAPSAKMKCPLSAPAKSSKARISQLTAIASISQKISDVQVKVRPLPKLNSTPIAKAKQSSVATKALTTPRHQKCLPNTDPFRSVQNSKTTIAMLKNRVVAKTLVFHSPKKTETKNLVECHTPVKELCAGMKKLEISQISSDTKVISGNSHKSSTSIACDPRKIVPASGSSRKKLSACKPKIRTEDEAKSGRGLRSKRKGQKCDVSVPASGSSRKKSSACKPKIRTDDEAIWGRGLRSKRKGQKCDVSVPREGADDDSSDMEIDGKSRDASSEICFEFGCPKRNDGNGNEECLIGVKTCANLGAACTKEEPIPSSEGSPNSESPHSILRDVSSRKSSSLSNSVEDKDSEGKDHPKFLTSEEEGGESIEGNEKNIGSNSEEGNDSVDENFPIPHNLNGTGDESEENDDKENVSVADDNRILHQNNSQSERNIFHKHKACENSLKVTRLLGKTSKENAASVATGAQGVKYKKTKPTNPKPFRLRTDERGILREANSERRLHLLDPLKETSTVKRFPNGNLQGRDRNKIHSQFKHENDTIEVNKTESDKRIQKVQNTSERAVQQKIAVTAPRRQKVMQMEDGKEEKATQKIESSSKKAKSPSMRQQPGKPLRIASARKAMVQLGVIMETSSILRPKETTKSLKSDATTPYNAATAARSSSRGRRPATIPKEPNFHSIHVPKSCTKKSARIIPSKYLQAL